MVGEAAEAWALLEALHAEAAVGLGLGLLMTLPHLSYQLRHGGYDLLGTWGVGPAATMAGRIPSQTDPSEGHIPRAGRPNSFSW